MKHIPNILSTFRILLIPFFVWQMLQGNTIAAAVLLIVSGLTDLLDGFLARRYGWISDVGKVLDPLADKLTQVTVCILIGLQWPRLWPFCGLLLFKEFVMLVLGAWLVRKGVHLNGSRWFGKVVTFLFYAIAVALIFFPEMPGWTKIVLLAVVTVCAFIAGSMYIPEFRAYKKEALSTDDKPAADQ